MEYEIPRLRRYARYLARDSDYAEDLVQECLVKAVANIDRFQPGTNMRAWLFVILRNVFLNDRRREARAPFSGYVEQESPSLARRGNQEDQADLNDLCKAFERLSLEQREVLLLVAIEGLRYEEAADIVQIPVGTVRSRLSRARQALRELLEAEPGAGNNADEGKTGGEAAE